MLAIRPDGSHVVRVWNLVDLKSEPHNWIIEKTSYVIAMSAAGQFIAAYEGKNMRLYDIWTGELKVALANSELSEFGRLSPPALSDDGRIIAAHTVNNRLTAWEVCSGRELNQFPIAGSTLTQLSPMGSHLAVMDLHGGVNVFSMLLEKQASFGPAAGVTSLRGRALSFSSDETLLAVVLDKIPGGLDRPEIRDLKGSRRPRVFPGRRDISTLAFIPGSHSLLAGGGTKPRIWRLDPPRAPMPWRATLPRPGPLPSRPMARCWPQAATIRTSARRSSSGITPRAL